MNKSKLIEAVAVDLGGSKTNASRAIDAVIKSIKEGIESDESVTISGFGTFIKKQRPSAIHALTGAMKLKPTQA